MCSASYRLVVSAYNIVRRGFQIRHSNTYSLPKQARVGPQWLLPHLTHISPLNILGILILLSIKPLLGFGMSSKKVFRGLVVSCEDQYSLQHLNSMLSC